MVEELWVVEQLKRRRWSIAKDIYSTSAHTKRPDAEEDLRDWMADYPSGKFRITRYVPAEEVKA